MATQRGRKVRVEVATAYGTTKSVSEVTNANPGVASSTTHSLPAGTIGYFSTATGMMELEDTMAVSVASVTTDAFTLEDLDTSNFGNFSAGVFVPVSTWVTLSQATSYALTGGEAAAQDVTTLLDSQGQEEAGILSAQRMQLDNFSDPKATALAFIESAARSSTPVIFRITFANGERRIWRGVPSVPGEALSVGQMATSGFSTTVRGRAFKLAAAA